MNFFKLIFTTSILLSTCLFSSPLVIGISGASGSGKTTLARQLKEELGDKVTVITQDNYYHDMSDLTFEEKKLANFDCPDSSDFSLLTEHLMDLKNNLTIHQPNYDFCTHSRTNLVNVIKPTDILVVEGALLFVIPEIRDLCDIKLYK